MRRTLIGLLTATAVLSIAFAAACRDSSDDTQLDIDRNPILVLAGTATREAQSMEQHADDMETAAAARPDHAHWAADAATLRANASSVAFMANSAMAIYQDPGSQGGHAVELPRVFGDGVNLHALGETLAQHAQAMEAHAAVMREQAAGDPQLLSIIDSVAADAAGMKAAGEAAMDRGTELQNEARRLAGTVGVELPSGGEHEDR